MTTPHHALPLQQSERLQIIDSLRGIALLGILLMNIPVFGMPWELDLNLYLRNELSGPNYYTWWVVRLFFEGTMRGIFSLLFGAGCILLLERLEKRPPAGISPADIYYRRLLWLLVFGCIDACLFLWVGDVLYVYAAAGLFLFPFRHMKPKHLLLIAGLALAIGTFKGTTRLYEAKAKRTKGEYALQLEKQKIKLTPEQEEHKKQWKTHLEENKKETRLASVNKETKAHQRGYFSIMGHIYDKNVKFQSLSVYNIFFWDMMICFFLGMAFYRSGVLTGQRSFAFYWKMMLIGYLLGLPLNYYLLRSMIRVQFDFTRMADVMVIGWYEIKRVLLLLGHLGFLILVYKYRLVPRVMGWMAAVGQMAFTNYLMQSILCGFIFNGYGLRWYGALERYQFYYVVAGVWVFQIIFSNIWLRYFRFGPFEWLWRSLTYWKKQPFKRSAAAQPQLA